MNAQQLTPIVEKNKTTLQKVTVWKDGNGAKGAEARLQDVEERVKPENCLGIVTFNKYLEEQKKQREKRRGFRIGDIANVIQLLVLLLMVYKLFY